MRLEQPEDPTAAHFVESLVESVKVFGHRLVEHEIHVQVDVFLPAQRDTAAGSSQRKLTRQLYLTVLLVLLGYGNVGAVRLQLVRTDGAEHFTRYHKAQTVQVLDVVAFVFEQIVQTPVDSFNQIGK